MGAWPEKVEIVLCSMQVKLATDVALSRSPVTSHVKGTSSNYFKAYFDLWACPGLWNFWGGRVPPPCDAMDGGNVFTTVLCGVLHCCGCVIGPPFQSVEYITL